MMKSHLSSKDVRRFSPIVKRWHGSYDIYVVFTNEVKVQKSSNDDEDVK